MTSTRTVLHGAAALVLAALLVGPSAQAGTSAPPAGATVTPTGHPTNEWLMMGRNCGAGIS